jgi:cytochrome c5
MAGVIWFASAGVAPADDSTNAPAEKISAAQPDKKSGSAPAKKLSGVELYAVHCNRCHPERYPVELNQTQWKTIMTHMRVRANLPADQARAIMQYLQEEAGD